MANEYAVNQADLAAVADAIRQKGGTSNALAFPGGFVNAVAAIQAGNGGGTGAEIAGSASPIGNLMSNVLYAITSGAAARGEFTLASALPNTETLIFDSGLDTLTGFAYIDMDWDGVFISGTNKCVFGAALLDPSLDGEWVKNEKTPFTHYTTQYNQDTVNGAVGLKPSMTNSPFGMYVTSVRISGGAVYATAQYNNHASYTPFAAGHRYVWWAW